MTSRRNFDPLSYTPILQRRDIYVKDGVRFNQAGYDIFADFYKEVSADELARYQD